jgi:predicted DNA-binding transcriptional regulator YafY
MKKTTLEAESIKRDIFKIIKQHPKGCAASMIEKLLDSNVTRRTINSYILQLINENIIEKSGEQAGRYVNYTTKANKYKGQLSQLAGELDKEYTILLQEMILLFEELKVFGLNKKVKELLKYLKQLGGKNTSKVDKHSRILYLQDISTEINETVYSNLFDAVINKLKVEISYIRDFVNPEKIILHPHYFRQYNNRWNIIGYSETEKDVVHFAVERITEARILYNQKINGKLKITITKYNKYLYGIDRRSHKTPKMFTVKLMTTNPTTVHYFESKPPFPLSQMKIKRIANFVQYTFKAINNYEIRSLLNSYGANNCVWDVK